MDERDFSLNVGMLCNCCDYHSYELPDVEGLSIKQRQIIEELCKLCIENSRPTAVNG